MLFTLIEANFSHMPAFIIVFRKKYASQKSLFTTKVCAITLILIKIEQK